jgi:hypothetical protein
MKELDRVTGFFIEWPDPLDKIDAPEKRRQHALGPDPDPSVYARSILDPAYTQAKETAPRQAQPQRVKPRRKEVTKWSPLP